MVVLAYLWRGTPELEGKVAYGFGKLTESLASLAA
jgi:hypothetical protein